MQNLITYTYLTVIKLQETGETFDFITNEEYTLKLNVINKVFNK